MKDESKSKSSSSSGVKAGFGILVEGKVRSASAVANAELCASLMTGSCPPASAIDLTPAPSGDSAEIDSTLGGSTAVGPAGSMTLYFVLELPGWGPSSTGWNEMTPERDSAVPGGKSAEACVMSSAPKSRSV